MKDLRNIMKGLIGLLIFVGGINFADAQNVHERKITAIENGSETLGIANNVSGFLRKNGIFLLAIDNIDLEQYRVKVTDSRGVELYNETFKNSSIRKSLDLTNVLIGEIKIEVTGRRTVKIFKVGTNDPLYYVETIL